MAKIKEMTTHELQSNMTFMSEVPVVDPTFSGWNFDVSEWESKFHELIAEARRREEETK